MRSLLDACCISWALSILLHMNTQYGCIYYQTWGIIKHGVLSNMGYYQTWGTIKHEGGNQQVRHVAYKQIHIQYKVPFITQTLPSPLLTAWQFLVFPDHQPPYQV
jgi:hypothetical protein